jgi:electron transfer flavoprotein alpha subunit
MIRTSPTAGVQPRKQHLRSTFTLSLTAGLDVVDQVTKASIQQESRDLLHRAFNSARRRIQKAWAVAGGGKGLAKPVKYEQEVMMLNETLGAAWM